MKFFGTNQSLLFLLLVITAVTACGGNGGASSNSGNSVSDSEAIQLDTASLAIGFNGTDSVTSVTGSLTLLAAGSNGTTISWASNAASVIATNGTVTRPAFGTGDATVTLTATITINGTTDTKVFTLTVIETPQTDAEAIAADKTNLLITYGTGDSAGSVTQSLGLNMAGSSGTNITWAATFATGGADASSVVTANGTVNRPTNNRGNAVITMTATITKGTDAATKAFSITVLQLLAGTKTDFTVGSITFTMVDLPGKTTFTGPSDATQATVANNYTIAETEVTYELWKAVYDWATTDVGGMVRIDGGALYSFASPGQQGESMSSPYISTNQHPVAGINWRDAMVWCNALTEYMNAKNGTSLLVVYMIDTTFSTPIRTSTNNSVITFDTLGSEDAPYVNPNANGFRLPTSDEWDLAARYINDANNDGDIMDAGEYYPGNYTSGADADSSVTIGASDYDGDGDVEYTNETAVTAYNTGMTAPVKSLSPNAMGLYDMCGNKIEPVFDWDPANIGALRMQRGGEWALTNLIDYTVGNIISYPPYVSNGIRIARTP